MSTICLEIIRADNLIPKGLSWWPGCQIETVSAFHVSSGPTVTASWGTFWTTPPPEVRAFWIKVIGCSSTILTMPLGTQVLLLEFGANSMGEIRNLTRLFLPTTAVVTQVASVHLAGFGSIEGVLRAKMEITESPVLRNFVYGADNSLLRKAAAELSPNIRRFGVGREYGDYRIGKTVFTLEGNSPALSFQLKSPDGEECFRAVVWGMKLAEPVAFGAVVGNVLGLSLDVCAERLASFASLKGRGRVISLPGPERRFIVDDAYNANPVSMRSSLETFVALDSVGRKVAVLGDMRELGENENRYHEELIPLLEKVDRIVFVGEIWRTSLSSRNGWDFVSRWQEAVALLEEAPWNALLVKGSNSHRLGELVESFAGAKETDAR